jgi:hypothetical protein
MRYFLIELVRKSMELSRDEHGSDELPVLLAKEWHTMRPMDKTIGQRPIKYQKRTQFCLTSWQKVQFDQLTETELKYDNSFC